MNKVLIDSSVWIEYFAGNPEADCIDDLINEDRICINELILCEIVPFLKIKKQDELIDLLKSINLIQIQIDWNRIIEYQSENVKMKLFKVGIPDLIIMQNALDNNLEILSFDKHFQHLHKNHGVKLYNVAQS